MAHQWQGLIREYADWLPFDDGDPIVTLKEGGTPLVHARALDSRTGASVYVKVEGANPTGSFKDRGMTTAISQVLTTDAKVVACASTGNTSASAAAYAAAAGLSAAVILPAGKIAAGKLAQAIVHGATLVAVDGNFDDCLRIVRELTESHPVALVNSVNPYRLQGQKTAAFEIVDELGDAPDIHVLPVGNAGNISAYWMGYCEYAGRTALTSMARTAGAAPVSTKTPQMWGARARPRRREPGDRRHSHQNWKSGVVEVRRSRPRRFAGMDRQGDRRADPSSSIDPRRRDGRFRRTGVGRFRRRAFAGC